MPPKARIRKEMVVDAALEIVRSEGLDAVNVRRIASALGCSTQPVMYHYATVQALKADLYAAADTLHTSYILTPEPEIGNPMLAIGIRYVRFAKEEPQLFRLLFQSDQFAHQSFPELFAGEELAPLLEPLRAATGLDDAQAREVFQTLFICVHGAASLVANNSIAYDEADFTKLLTNTFLGTVGILKRGSAHEETV